MLEYKWLSVWGMENTMVDDENDIQSNIEGIVAQVMDEDFEFTVWRKVGLPSVDIGGDMFMLFRRAMT